MVCNLKGRLKSPVKNLQPNIAILILTGKFELLITKIIVIIAKCRVASFVQKLEFYVSLVFQLDAKNRHKPQQDSIVSLLEYSIKFFTSFKNKLTASFTMKIIKQILN